MSSFKHVTLYTSANGNESVRRLTTIDADNNGYADIIFGDGKDVVMILNPATESIVKQRTVKIRSSFEKIREITAGDFNADGQQDIAYTSWNTSETEIVLLKKDLEIISKQIVSASGSDIIAHDLNMDGLPEIVLGGSLYILENIRGAFTVGQQVANSVKNLSLGDNTFAAGLMSPESIAVSDINYDGIPDIISGSSNSNFNRIPYRIQVTYGKGNAQFENFSTIEIENKNITNIGITDVIKGDFNGDNIDDIVSFNGNMYSGTFFEGTRQLVSHSFDYLNQNTWINGAKDVFNNSANIKPGKDFKLPDSPWNAVSADFTGDGIRDIAFTDYRLGIGGVYIMRGIGDGQFIQYEKIPTGSRPEGIITADFNLDGIDDIATANAGRWDGDRGGEYVQSSITLILGTKPQANYSLSLSATAINEGSALATTVSTTNVSAGTELFYSLSGPGITSADFSLGSLTGSGRVSSNGIFSFSHTLANDLTTEGTETLKINLYSDSSRLTQVASTSVSISDTSITPPSLPSYSLTPSATTINEGSLVSTTITTTNVSAGTTLYWSAVGSGITTSDLSFGSLSGTSSIGSDGKATFSHVLANDQTTEGSETLNILLYSDSNRNNQMATTSIAINDTSIAPPPPAVSVSGNNNGIANTGSINNNGNINTGTINSNSGNTTNNTNNTTNNITNITYVYYNSENTTSNSGNTTTNTNSGNTLNSWNVIKVDKSVKAGDIVNQWFGNGTPFQKQVQDITDTKLMDIVASSWSDKVQINRVAKASDNGDVLEGKQRDATVDGVVGSVLTGGKGSDRIQAMAGWDIVEGGEGNDLVRAGNGRDILTGGSGKDELWGGFGWNTYKGDKDGSEDLLVIKSDEWQVNSLNGKAGNNPDGSKCDIIEALDSIDKIIVQGVNTSDLRFAANVNGQGLTGIGIYAKGALEALYTGGDLSVAQLTAMTTGDVTGPANGTYWSW